MDSATAPTGRARVWLLAARLPTLPASIAPVLVGTAVAADEGEFRFPVFVATLLAAVLLQVGANLANDYFDFRKGADTTERLGPLRVTQSGLASPAAVRLAALVTFGVAALLGLYLVSVGGWPVLAVGLASIAAAILYTGGPWPFGYHGLGDLFVFVFFGLLAVPGTVYLHTDTVEGRALLAAIPVGATVTAILVVNNLRDIDTDRITGKRTLAVLVGARATRLEYVGLLALTYLLPAAAWMLGDLSAWVWLTWLTMPMAVYLARAVLAWEGRALNRALRDTARLHLLFGSLFALSFML
ncbi:MAG: 1,4-dihydroxy-2-naphthoate polyprenyltransferase [Dehalococcoidia bacterium]|nr:1,4-dihydroxy-2-naphthoate polyprenyltransferase [Dehalococcoidia bacterium]